MSSDVLHVLLAEWEVHISQPVTQEMTSMKIATYKEIKWMYNERFHPHSVSIKHYLPSSQSSERTCHVNTLTSYRIISVPKKTPIPQNPITLKCLKGRNNAKSYTMFHGCTQFYFSNGNYSYLWKALPYYKPLLYWCFPIFWLKRIFLIQY